MSSIIFGTLSLLGDDTNYLDKRVEMHRRQVEWLDGLQDMMAAKGLPTYPWYRVEQMWNAEREEILASKYAVSLKYDHRVKSGAARNILLKQLYESDADWLVMMDDDMGLYDHYAGYELLWNLATEPLIDVAKKAYILMPFPAYWNGFTQEVNRFGKGDTHWLFLRTIHASLPFACIPNIKKFMNKEVWFDAYTESKLPGDAPEDLKFGIDWLRITKGRWLECRNMIGKSFGNLNASSIFATPEERDARVATDEDWVKQYLRELYPRNTKLWTKKGFLRMRNPLIRLQVPRFRYD